MQRYIVKRLFQTIITLFVLSMAIFLMGRLSGDPCDLLLPDEAEATEFQLCAEQLGLTKPVYVQYWIWVKGAVRGDFGRAYVSGKPVIELILQRFPNSIKLGIASMIFTTIVSLPLGLIAAVKKDTWIDTVTKTLAVLGQSLPSFWLGIMLVWVLAVQFSMGRQVNENKIAPEANPKSRPERNLHRKRTEFFIVSCAVEFDLMSLNHTRIGVSN